MRFTGFEVERGLTGDGIAPMEPREYDHGRAMAHRGLLGGLLAAMHAAGGECDEELGDLDAEREELDRQENQEPDRFDEAFEGRH